MADTPDAAAVQAAIERAHSSMEWTPETMRNDCELFADACEHYQRELADANAKFEDMRQRNRWLRRRWDLMPDDMRKNARYEVLERMDRAEQQLAAALARERGLREQWREMARICGCLEPGENGKPACDPPCLACAALAAEPKP